MKIDLIKMTKQILRIQPLVSDKEPPTLWCHVCGQNVAPQQGEMCDDCYMAINNIPEENPHQ